MSENKVSFITYTKEHETIVENGIKSISEILSGTNVAEKRSLLFCLDKYLDPYYGYNLPYFDDLLLLLQKVLFLNDDKDVKEDILDLLAEYSNDSLDYLAEKIEEIESELLKYVLLILADTYNCKYVPIFSRYENDDNLVVQSIAKKALSELSKSNNSINE